MSRRLLFALAVALVGGALLFMHGRAAVLAPPVTPPDRAPTVTGAAVRGPAGAVAVTSASRWFVDERAPPLVMSGTVRDGAGPRAGAVVTLVDLVVTGGALPLRRATTDARGVFAFTGVPAVRGSYRVTAMAEGLAPTWVVVPGAASDEAIALYLGSCDTRVYGTVADASGGVVSGACLRLLEAPDATILSDALGEFRLCTPASSFTLLASAAGYGTWQKRISPRGAQRQDVILAPEASLAGRAVRVDGGPVPLAIVRAQLAGGAREVQADDTGYFSFASIAPGSIEVTARAPGFKSRQPVRVAVFASARNDVEVPLETRTTLRGHLVAGSAPIAGATVNVGIRASAEWATPARTGADGGFVLDDAPIGPVVVSVDDHEVITPRTLVVTPSGADDVHIVAAAKATMVVSVVRDGARVHDASVFARSTNASARASTVGGDATLRGLADGLYRVVVEHDDGFGVAEDVRVSRDAVARVTVDLARGRQIEGRVVDETGAPVDGARIALTPSGKVEDTGAAAVTGADGTFRGGPLRGPATYEARVSRSEVILEPHAPFPNIAVAASGPASPAFAVFTVKRPSHELRGTVVDADGGPIADARVTLSRGARHDDDVATTYTGADGTFAFRALGPGPWALRTLTVEGGESELRPLSLPVAPVRIVIPGVTTLRGTLEGFARRPSVMAWRVTGYDSDDIRYARVSGDTFTIEGLSRGRYHVAAATEAHAADVTLDIGGGVATVHLKADGSRRVGGRAVDLVTGRPLPDLSCQAAPFVGEGRSPVLVPGSVFTAENGTFEFPAAPASELYMWCWGNDKAHGGVARIPVNLGSERVTVFGIATAGRPTVRTEALGLVLADDFPLSRRVDRLEPQGAAERSGLRPGDVVERIGDTPMAGVGNGTMRVYLALVLATQGRVVLTVTRGGGSESLVFAMDPRR